MYYSHYILTHAHDPKLLPEFDGKEIYVVFGLFLNGHTVWDRQIWYQDFVNSPYYEFVLDAGRYHPLRHVFRLKKEKLLQDSTEYYLQ